MATTTATETYAMLWPDGRLDLSMEVLDRLELEGGWQCTVEIVGDAIIVRPVIAVPDEDLWAYTPEHLDEVRQALAEPPEEALRLSPRDLRDLIERRTTVDELRARSEQ
jgi:hypothetical protein